MEPLLLKLHMRVADVLGEAVVRGEYPVGTVLPGEMQLCDVLGVSRTAVREAVRGLVAKGLLESRPKRGTIVRHQMYWNHLDADVLRWRIETTDTATYIDKMFDLRRATEPEAAFLAACHARPEDLERMAAAYRAMTDAGSEDKAWIEADLAFHQSIYLATRNEFFWPIGHMLAISLQKMFSISARGHHRPRALVEHGDLLNAISEGKPELARAASLTLLGNAASDIDRIRIKGR